MLAPITSGSMRETSFIIIPAKAGATEPAVILAAGLGGLIPRVDAASRAGASSARWRACVA
jgi:hypothetical protein